MLDIFSPAVSEWFATSFPEPTPPQVAGWPHIADGEHTLICSPTGSGKTLTAFLASIDRLVTTPPPDDRTRRTRVLYVSPLRALAFDIEKNLRAPLVGIGLAAERIGVPFVAPEVAMRTGDTSSNERQKLVRRPPDLLITTPESLYLMLTSAATETLRGVETVIIDEIHALATTKRGAHLALTLERLETVTDAPPQRIGLSATQRPLEEIARFLGGYSDADTPRPVRVIDPGSSHDLVVEVVVPVEDMANPPDIGQSGAGPTADRRSSIWPSIYPKVLELVLSHRSTIVFCNARRAAERLAAKLNELHDELHPPEEGTEPVELVRAHHGSLAREQRIVIEDQLKRGELRAIVATSSLELGIDMGAVDLVVQIESPGAVSRGLQRIGRAGHSVGRTSRGSIFPKHRGDLVEAAVVGRRMLRGEIESSRYLRNPLDVLAQQIVAHAAASTEVTVAELAVLVRRCACFHELSDELLGNVLDLLAGRYPSEEFAELRPRLVWDRVTDVIRARDGAKRLAVTSGGTIPDRGLFGVFLPDGTRVGELDEEMVYESRPGETFLLGASTWRIEDISFERVTVSPAPGEPGKMPFWHGDRPGRPLELGRAVGAFLREVRGLDTAAGPGPALAHLGAEYGLDAFAAANVLQYVAEQVEATGAVPDDRTIVVERFRDEIGDWRICILSPFGTPVHAPWAMAIERRLLERFDLPVETMWSDDGIVVRLPESADRLDPEVFAIDPTEIDELVVAGLPQTSLFAARFRECAGRALLLPRRRPDRRTPLWQQRQRAADLLTVASKYPTFPILLETSRECLQDVFDVPALREVLTGLQSRRLRLVSVDTPAASPMASSLLFGWIAQYMYEGDAPLAERRAAALSLDRDLLRELLGAEELRELLDPLVLADVELELQRLAPHRRARSVDELHDVLRAVGDLTADEVLARCDADGSDRLATLLAERRAIEVTIGSTVRYAAAEDASAYRDALGCALPLGLPTAFTEPVARPLEMLVGRYARTHGPFLLAEVAERFATTAERVDGVIRALAEADRVVRGEFRPDGVQREWCDADVLRQLRRRSLAALRRDVEPVEPAALARFVVGWHGIPADRGGTEVLVDAIGLLAGAPVVASTLERDVLPARVRRYQPADLDELCASGEVVWTGAGAIGTRDGRIRLCFADQLDVLAAGWPRAADPPDRALHEAIRSFLADRGASFWGQLRAADATATDTELLVALWDLVWAGEVTNDTLAPLRSLLGSGGVQRPPSAAARRSATRRPRPTRLTRLGPPAAAGRWSLSSSQFVAGGRAPTPTEVAHARALQLLERHGVVTREVAAAEGVVGGYAAVYPVLKVLEERGQARRGYFVSGLGGAQFALPGAVDRLRSHRESSADRDDTRPVVLASTDPAQPYGSSLPWPPSAGRPVRSGSSIVVLEDGEPTAWFDRSAHHLVTFPGTTSSDRWATALADLVGSGRERSVEVRRVDGGPVPDPVAAALRSVGFVDGYRGLVRRS